MFCSRYLPLFGKPLSRIFVTMILRPFFMVHSNDDSHKTRINKFSTNHVCTSKNQSYHNAIEYDLLYWLKDFCIIIYYQGYLTYLH